MTKLALRQQFLAQRRSLSAVDVAHQSKQISDVFFNDILTRSSIKTLHTFLPITHQKEVDTWPIIHRIWQDFPTVQVAVSVTNIVSHQLTHYVLARDTPLVENGWGIPEPAPSADQEVSSNQIDLVLMPLLTFDTWGHRVGYGKGYYDRFLAGTQPGCLKVGLSLFDPVECINDVVPTDIRLDMCVMPTGVYQFAN